MAAYRDLNTVLRERFGGKVYKIALSTPFSCPNRDGTKGVGGCLFCGEGSGAFAAKGEIASQLQEAKARVSRKLPKGENPRYLAYFQTGSSTYGPLEIQRALFSRAMADEEVVGLAVATRPDCVDRDVITLLSDLNRQKRVWVELGLQTAREDTGRLIRRAYTNGDFAHAVKALHAAGLEVVAHLILGLPGEDHRDEINSLRFVTDLGVEGVKFHLLHVLRGTALAEMDYTPLTLEEYVFRVTNLIRYLPPDVVVHRLTGDGAKKDLIAPLWSGDKKRVLNTIHRRLREENIQQGELFRGSAPNPCQGSTPDPAQGLSKG